MGNGATKGHDTQAEENKRIDKELKKENQQLAIKMLLLGPGESGKSTILKQMKILHDNGFTAEDQVRQKVVVFANIINTTHDIVRAMATLQIQFRDEGRATDAEYIARLATADKEHTHFSEELRDTVLRLYKDEGFQECISRSGEIQINESTLYFYTKLHSIAQDDYVPSYDDILLCRVKTTGVVEVHFVMKGVKFRVFDVGGQRSERKKWIHCFDDVNAVIYVVALSEYNQMLFEDNSMNRMHESLRLFDSVVNCMWFRHASVLLFLNKTDLFEEKLKHTALKVAFPDYGGQNTPEECVDYIIGQFQRCNVDMTKEIYIHQTCATDTGQVSFVLDACLDLVLRKNIRTVGLTRE